MSTLHPVTQSDGLASLFQLSNLKRAICVGCSGKPKWFNLRKTRVDPEIALGHKSEKRQCVGRLNTAAALPLHVATLGSAAAVTGQSRLRQ